MAHGLHEPQLGVLCVLGHQRAGRGLGEAAVGRDGHVLLGALVDDRVQADQQVLDGLRRRD